MGTRKKKRKGNEEKYEKQLNVRNNKELHRGHTRLINTG